MSECLHQNQNYCHKLDAVYCRDCLDWLQDKCSENKYCEFCWKRPDKAECDPSNCHRYSCKMVIN